MSKKNNNGGKAVENDLAEKVKVLGSIEKRSNGYRIKFSFGKDRASGKYRAVLVSGFETRLQAENARTALNVALQEGDKKMNVKPGPECFKAVVEKNGWKMSGRLPGADTDRVTLHDLCMAFLDYRRTHSWNGYQPMPFKSYENKTGFIRNHLGAYGKTDVKEVSRKGLKKLTEDVDKKASARMAKEVMNVVRPALQYAVEERELLTESPAEGMGSNVFASEDGTGKKSPRTNALGIWDDEGNLKPEPPYILLQHEYAAALEWLKGFDLMWYVFSLVALASGLRLGGLAGLKKSDCRLGGAMPSITTRGGITRGKNGPVHSTGKNHGRGGHAVATAILDPFTAGVLKAYLASADWKARARRVGDSGEDAYVFRTRAGQWPTADSWDEPFADALSAAGIDKEQQVARDLTPNSWRHTYITEAVARGEQIEEIAKRVGSSVDMIRRQYYHSTPERQAKLAWNPLADSTPSDQPGAGSQ